MTGREMNERRPTTKMFYFHFVRPILSFFFVSSGGGHGSSMRRDNSGPVEPAPWTQTPA